MQTGAQKVNRRLFLAGLAAARAIPAAKAHEREMHRFRAARFDIEMPVEYALDTAATVLAPSPIPFGERLHLRLTVLHRLYRSTLRNGHRLANIGPEDLPMI